MVPDPWHVDKLLYFSQNTIYFTAHHHEAWLFFAALAPSAGPGSCLFKIKTNLGLCTSSHHSLKPKAVLVLKNTPNNSARGYPFLVYVGCVLSATGVSPRVWQIFLWWFYKLCMLTTFLCVMCVCVMPRLPDWEEEQHQRETASAREKMQGQGTQCVCNLGIACLKRGLDCATIVQKGQTHSKNGTHTIFFGFLQIAGNSNRCSVCTRVDWKKNITERCLFTEAIHTFLCLVVLYGGKNCAAAQNL